MDKKKILPKFFKKALGIAQAVGFKPLVQDIQKELDGIGKIKRQ